MRLKVAEGLRLIKQKEFQGSAGERPHEQVNWSFGIRPEDIARGCFLGSFLPVVHAKNFCFRIAGSRVPSAAGRLCSEFVARVDSRDYLETGAGIDLGFDLNKAQFLIQRWEDSLLISWWTKNADRLICVFKMAAITSFFASKVAQILLVLVFPIRISAEMVACVSWSQLIRFFFSTCKE